MIGDPRYHLKTSASHSATIATSRELISLENCPEGGLEI